VLTGTKNQVSLEIAHNTLGHALIELERFSDAVQQFSEVIKLNQNIAGYYDNRRNAYQQLKDFDLAMNDANKAIQLALTYSFVYRSRAYLFSDIGNFKDGIADYTRAIEISPLDGGLFIDRGKSFRSAKLYDPAIADFSHALEIDTKKWAGAYRERGLTYKQVGRLDLARSDLELYAQLFPQDQEVQTALEHLSHSTSPTPTPSVAFRGRRVALVIGNRDYTNAALANPVFDADLVSSSLKKIGFEVTEVKNADFKAMDVAITNFVAKEDRPDIVLLYSAGHGFAISDGLRQRNYLMSTSADLSATSEAVLRRDGMPLDE
jgi:tetratricopeptide (TPR) repeat protein